MNKKQIKVSQTLSRQLEQASANQRPVQAVFTLDMPVKKLLNPEEVEAATKLVLEGAEQTAGTKAQDYNVFRNMGAFAVKADASFVRALINQPGLKGAVANQEDSEGAIKESNAAK